MRNADNPAECEKCRSTEIDGSGACLVCGFVSSPSSPEARSEESRHVGAFEIESSVPGSGRLTDPSEIPEWRLELSRRLQQIKQKRDIPGEHDLPRVQEPESAALAAAKQEEDPAMTRLGFWAAATGSAATVSPDEPAAVKSAAAPPAVPEPPPPSKRIAGTVPVDVKPPSAGLPQPAPERDRTVEDIRTLIDRMVLKKPGTEEPAPEAAPAPPRRMFIGPEPETDRLMLLSRTFSGLVDVIIVVLIGSALIFAVDIIEGIEIFDTVSLLYYLSLLIIIFLVYSVFFLATATQTIGMMLTDLRVVNRLHARPHLVQVFIRSITFLVALSAAGIGLAIGFFDRETRCLHDRLSGTNVIRVQPY